MNFESCGIDAHFYNWWNWSTPTNYIIMMRCFLNQTFCFTRSFFQFSGIISRFHFSFSYFASIERYPSTSVSLYALAFVLVSEILLSACQSEIIDKSMFSVSLSISYSVEMSRRIYFFKYLFIYLLWEFDFWLLTHFALVMNERNILTINCA